METTCNECSDGNKGGKDEHYYSVLGSVRGNDAAFSQSNNAFKYLYACVLRGSTFLHILCFSTAVLLPSHSCWVLYVCTSIPIYSFMDVWLTAAVCMELPWLNRTHFYTRLTPLLHCFVRISNWSGGFYITIPFVDNEVYPWKRYFIRRRGGTSADVCACRAQTGRIVTNYASKCF